MKIDIVLAGVGGQGVLSVAAIIAASALHQGLHVKQGEVHGMSQRGGAVQANLRLSDRRIHSDLVPEGGASMILAVEPLEALRYLRYLKPDGIVVTSVDPFANIPNYPPIEEVLAKLRQLHDAHLVEADRLAREAGSKRASNVVMVGAASLWLPIEPAVIEQEIRTLFARKGEKVVDACLRAFALGREAAPCTQN